MQTGFLTRGTAAGTSAPAPGRGVSHVVCVATPSKPPASRLAKRSKVEIIKEKSDFLRHPLMEELMNEETFIGEESMQLMKFHGSYQQDHREKRAFGAGKSYMFMMRTRQPAGAVTNQLYLAMDELADKVSSGGHLRHGHSCNFTVKSRWSCNGYICVHSNRSAAAACSAPTTICAEVVGPDVHLSATIECVPSLR